MEPKLAEQINGPQMGRVELSPKGKLFCDFLESIGFKLVTVEQPKQASKKRQRKTGKCQIKPSC
jgi:hypothetical protein